MLKDRARLADPNQSFHYHGNAETYMRVGEAMGRAIVKLQKEPR